MSSGAKVNHARLPTCEAGVVDRSEGSVLGACPKSCRPELRRKGDARGTGGGYGLYQG
jgi:hypothetical protein